MNLAQSVGLESLRLAGQLRKEKKTRVQIEAMLAGKVSGHATDWLSSGEFLLLDVPLHYASTPLPIPRNQILAGLHASADSEHGVVIDLNRKKIGMTALGTYHPPVIVVAGQASVAAARLAGRETILAWIGRQAAERVKLIHADAQFSSNELDSKLSEALLESMGIISDYSVPLPAGTSRPWVQEVYPLENTFVYNLQQQSYKQKYSADPDTRTAKLIGKAVPVKQKYVAMSAAKATKACGMNMAQSAMLYSGGVSTSLSNGSGSPHKSGQVMADFSGIPAPQKTSATTARKSRGGSRSEMAELLKDNDKPDVDAEGTSEGAKKGWDTRGRGRQSKGDKNLKQRLSRRHSYDSPTAKRMRKELNDDWVDDHGDEGREDRENLHGAGGYKGYKDATATQSKKTKGASGSEMAPQLKGSDPNAVTTMVNKVQAVVRKEGNQYVVRSHKGKNLGKFGSHGEAKKRLAEIEYFKHKG